MNSYFKAAFLALVSLLVLVQPANVLALAPAPRDQVSLNGSDWKIDGKKGTVPTYDSQNSSIVTTKLYTKSVTIPNNWNEKVIKLEFGAVNYVCDIFVVNGNKSTQVFVDDPELSTKVGPGYSHVGAWVPFSIDITDLVKPGQTFELKVKVYSKLVLPTSNNGKIIYWIGHNDTEPPSKLNSLRCGIVDDVWLRAYGKVHIEDSFIQTSFRNKSITVQYEVYNTTSTTWTGKITGDIALQGSKTVEKSIVSPVVSIKAGESKVVTVTSAWSNASLWWPDDPKLYILNSKLVTTSNQSIIDSEVKRFGFREFWTEGTQFRLNGVHINLRGDWVCFSQYWGSIRSPEQLEKLYRDLRDETGANILRLHKHPAPKFAYDLADETGLMILAETAFYSRSYMNRLNAEEKTAFIYRNLPLVKSFVKNVRNNPSVVMWSGCNEMTTSMSKFTRDQLAPIGDAIKSVDGTRPVTYDSDGNVSNTDVIGIHYPEGYENNVTGNPYTAWAGRISSSKPTYFGEIMAVRPDNDNNWWVGVWSRGLRYLNAAYFAPRVFYPTGRAGWGPEQKSLQEAAYHPIAVFDKDYDQLGIKPFKNKIYPSLAEGATLTRNLVVYNDDFRNTSVKVKVSLYVNNTRFATGEQTYTIPLGEHKEITASFQVPKQAGKNLELRLETSKTPQSSYYEAFSEDKIFQIQASSYKGNTSGVVTLSGGTPHTPPPNSSPTVQLTSPGNNSEYFAPASVTINATASDSDGSISRVEFYSNGLLVGTDNTAPYSFSLSSLAVGNYTLTAKAYDNLHASTTSAPVAIKVKVNQAPTVNITSPASNSSYMAPATISFNVSALDSDGSVSKVEYFDGNTKIGQSTVSPFGYTWQNVPVGNHSVTAKATDNSGNTSTSPAINIVVKENKLPSISISSPKDGATYIAPASVSIAVKANDSDGTISKVEFFNGNSKIGENSIAPFGFTWSNVAPGQYSITAKATDNLNASASSAAINISVKKNAPPSVGITSPSSGTVLIAPASLALKVLAVDSDGSVAKVEYFNGNTKLSESVLAPFGLNLTNLGAGNYSITAKATDNSGNSATSGPVLVTIKNNEAPTVSITSISSSVLLAPATINLTVSASDSDGTVTKVEYFTESVKIGESTAVPFTFKWADVAAGSYKVTAKATDDRGAVGISAPVEFSVKNPNKKPSVQITAPVSGSKFSSLDSIRFFARAVDSDGTIKHVDFYLNGKFFKIERYLPYEFHRTLAPGNYELKAVAFDNEGTAGESEVIQFTVVQPKALFVTDNPDGLGDASVKTRLEGIGFEVATVSALKSQASDADGKDLVVISSTISSKDVGAKFSDVGVSVLTWESHLLDDLHMTGDAKYTDYFRDPDLTTAVITDSTHTLAAGLSGSQVLFSTPGIMSWGKPNANAIVVATLENNSNKSVIFAYDKGSAMFGMTAPARRVFLFLEDNGLTAATPAGVALFDRAVKWAVNH